VLTRYMDGRTDEWTDGQGDSYIPPQTLFAGGIIIKQIQNMNNMRQVQPETLPKNSNFPSCLQNIKLKNNTT
jgi:hypothetical protein